MTCKIHICLSIRGSDWQMWSITACVSLQTKLIKVAKNLWVAVLQHCGHYLNRTSAEMMLTGRPSLMFYSCPLNQRKVYWQFGERGRWKLIGEKPFSSWLNAGTLCCSTQRQHEKQFRSHLNFSHIFLAISIPIYWLCLIVVCGHCNWFVDLVSSENNLLLNPLVPLKVTFRDQV